MVIHNTKNRTTPTMCNGLWIRPRAMNIKTLFDTLCSLATATFIAATELKQKYCLTLSGWCKVFHSFWKVITRSYLDWHRGELPKWDLYTVWEKTPCSARVSLSAAVRALESSQGLSEAGDHLLPLATLQHSNLSLILQAKHACIGTSEAPAQQQMAFGHVNDIWATEPAD